MKKYIDLNIKCNSEETSIQILRSIAEECTGDVFKCSLDCEDKGNNCKSLNIKVAIDSLPKSIIILYSSDNVVQVVNVIPNEDTNTALLTKDQYNKIIKKFYVEIIEPLFENKYEINVSPEEIEMETIIPDSYQALHQWVCCPGAPNDPFLHPNDLKRWFNFICTIHDSEETLGSGDLEQWLLEDRGWSEEVVTETIIRYETETELLNYYDNH